MVDGQAPIAGSAENPNSDTQFEFTPKTELLALRIIISDRNFVNKWLGRVSQNHFQHPWNGLIFRSVERFVQMHSTLPSLNVLEAILFRELMTDDPIREIIQHLHAFMAENPDESEVLFLKDHLMRHIARLDWSEFVCDAAAMVAEGQFDDIPERLSKIIGRHFINPVVEEYRTHTVEERVAEESKDYSITPSRYPTFNKRHGGGHVMGTLAAYMGPAGCGKSIMLVNDGAHAVMQGKTVFHFTFELSKMKTEARYDVVLSGMTYEQRSADPSMVDNTLNSLRKQGMGSLYVIERPTGTCSSAQLEAAIEEQVMVCGKRPEVIVVDYMTIMLPNDTATTDMKNDYSKLKRIAEELRAVAMRNNYQIVSALQSNRGSINHVDDGIGKGDIADSFAVIHVLDDCISINQNLHEKKNGRVNLWSAKSRDFEDEYWICLSINYGNLRTAEIVTETEARNKNQLEKEQYRGQPGSRTALPAPPPDHVPKTLGESHQRLVQIGQTIEERDINATVGHHPKAPPPPVNASMKPIEGQPPINAS